MIEVCNVSKRFGTQVIYDRANLTIPDGITTAIVGPSGVGKSVLMKLMMGILQPDEGEILINGKSMTAASSEAERNCIRAELGILFQSAALFDSLTVYDNIAFPLRERAFGARLSEKEIHSEVCAMLAALSLEPYVKNVPQEISVGIRKRVGMGRALITKPSVLLFDEPNTGLDPLAGQEVYDLIKLSKQRWGFTGVVISHEIPEVFQISDRVVMVLGGKIIADAPPDELVKSSDPAIVQFLSGSVHGPITIQ